MQKFRQIYPRIISTLTSTSTPTRTMSTTTNTNPTSSPTRLTRFQEAQESVYGNISSISSPETWTPPPKSGGHKGRYLWTDAFGVLNFITLHREHQRQQKQSEQQADGTDGAPTETEAKDKDKDKYLTLAKRLVQTVHEILGRTRDGRTRLPGATDTNPLGGGLRIGKMDDRGPDADGQYHHYLTIWMFALNRLSLATNDPLYNQQAVALAKAIHPRFFVNRKSDRPRMVWKMAMDLSAPLVASEGNLDPIDGYVVFRLLQGTAASQDDGDKNVLQEEIGDYLRVMRRKGEQFVSSDPLDLGMTLWTAHWFSEEDWAARLAGRCFEQIYDLFEINRYLERPTKYRLAFREFGTAMGIQCHSDQETEKERSVDLKVYADAIVGAWDPYMQASMSAGLVEDDLRPITRVMYAAALIPGAFRCGYLGPEPKREVK